jgi:hypothetical protein
MKKLRDLEDELNLTAKSYYEESRNIQDAHNGKWAGWVFIIAIIGLCGLFVFGVMFAFA